MYIDSIYIDVKDVPGAVSFFKQFLRSPLRLSGTLLISTWLAWRWSLSWGCLSLMEASSKLEIGWCQCVKNGRGNFFIADVSEVEVKPNYNALVSSYISHNKQCRTFLHLVSRSSSSPCPEARMIGRRMVEKAEGRDTRFAISLNTYVTP